MDYEYMISEIFGVTFGIVMAIFLVVYLLGLALGILLYVLRSLSLHTIAKRRGIRHGWLAWIPVGMLWVLGSISDQYQYVVKGKVRNRRGVLLGLFIASLVCTFFNSVGIAVAALALGVGSLTSFTGWTVAIIFCLLAAAAVSVTMVVFRYICLYDLFVSCDPSQAALFLVLSIVLPVTLPFFLMSCRKKDLGMPERKPEPAAALEVCEDDFEEYAEEIPEQETPSGDFEEEGLDEAIEE